MRKLTFTTKAEQRLEEISDWTFERFGPRQADIYEQELISKCLAIASGMAVTQSCSILTPANLSPPLRFGRSGKHLIIYLEHRDKCVIIDLMHSSSNLATGIERLARLTTAGTAET